MNKLEQFHLERLQIWMRQEALRIAGGVEQDQETFAAMLQEPPRIHLWWDGTFPPNDAAVAQLDNAARAIARGEPIPALPAPQRARLALRLMLASRVLRPLAKAERPPGGWFANTLARMSQRELLEWLLVKTWPMWLEVMDETLQWSDQHAPPAAPPPPPPLTSGAGLN